MSRPRLPGIVAANDLRDGASVWLTELGGWSRDVCDALVVTTADEAAHHLALAEAQSGTVVGPTIIPVESAPSGPRPLDLRERIRTSGPFPEPRTGVAA